MNKTTYLTLELQEKQDAVDKQIAGARSATQDAARANAELGREIREHFTQKSVLLTVEAQQYGLTAEDVARRNLGARVVIEAPNK